MQNDKKLGSAFAGFFALSNRKSNPIRTRHDFWFDLPITTITIGISWNIGLVRGLQ
jgi:hypothetical protein